jgi:DNA-binding CsgD family transcriptional regulator
MNTSSAETRYEWDRTDSEGDSLPIQSISMPAAENPATHPARLLRHVHLTNRDRDMIQGAMDDKGNKQIALDLGLSENTVKVYRSKIFSKLGVNGHRELARWGRAYAEFERRTAKRYHEQHPDEPQPPTFEDIGLAAWEVFRTAAQTIELTAEQKSEVMELLFTTKKQERAATVAMAT